MKKFFYLILYITNLIYAHNTFSIVLYHDGPSLLPDYTYYTLKQLRTFNKLDNIYFITNEKSANKIKKWKLDKEINVIKTENLRKSDLHKQFQLLKRNPNVKDGSWLWFCFERFFGIHSLMNERNLTNVIHIENDCLLYSDVSTLIDQMILNYNIGVTSASKDCVIMNLCFFKNKEVLSALLEFTLNNWDLQNNEMILFNQFKILHPEIMQNLPTANSNIAKSQNITPTNHYDPCYNADVFNSIFDAARIGQYICGKYEAINEEFRPYEFKFEWIADECGRRIPYLIQTIDGELKYTKINNLHCHAKNTHLFLSLGK